MNLQTYTTGIQHIGIPTNDIEKTIEFYKNLGFEIALQTINEEANEKVAFLKLKTLVIETTRISRQSLQMVRLITWQLM